MRQAANAIGCSHKIILETRKVFLVSFFYKKKRNKQKKAAKDLLNEDS